MIDASAAIVVISNIRMGTAISRRPVIHGMTGCAVESEQANMIGRIAMTACAGCRDLDKPAAFVTALALHAGMPASQGEVAAVVVEIRILPIGGVMAGSTIRSVSAIVLIVLPVAGITVHRRAFVLPVDMARLAVCFRVFPLQFEGRQVVVERCGDPAVFCVAVPTANTKASLVRLIRLVTGIAVLKRDREIA